MSSSHTPEHSEYPATSAPQYSRSSNTPELSVIVCSGSQTTLDLHRRHVEETVGVPVEFIGINNESNEHSLALAYNLGGALATTDLLVFVHDDVFFTESGWGGVLLDKFAANSRLGLVGLAGTAYLDAQHPAWTAAKEPFIHGRVIHHTASMRVSYYSEETTDQRVVAVDGLLLAVSREAFDQHRFDEAIFDGFHLYDIDLGVRVSETHDVIVTHDVLVKHLSGGVFGKTWKRYRDKFRKKYPDRTWQCVPGKPAPDAYRRRLTSHRPEQSLLDEELLERAEALGAGHPKYPESALTNILFVHTSYPAQFKHLLPALQKSGEYRLAFISTREKPPHDDGILFQRYKFERRSKDPGVHRYNHRTNEAVREAREVAVSATELVSRGFVPDIIVGHTSFGGLLFMRDVFPTARIVGYCELYSSPDYVPASTEVRKVSTDYKASLRSLNFHKLMQMELMDVGVTPTEYQRDSHPDLVKDKLKVLHEGVDTTLCAPDENALFPIKKSNIELTRDDQVVTYVSRGFEPARGFYEYMAAVEILCRELPDAHFLMVGGDKVYYSGSRAREKNHREIAMERYDIDQDRVHFTGWLSHEGFRKAVQISSAHCYLTKPLFLSWSALEAMSMAAPIVASDQRLIREFMTDNEHALLVDHADPGAIAESIVRLVNDKELAQRLGRNARRSVVENLDIRVTVPRWIEVIEEQRAAATEG